MKYLVRTLYLIFILPLFLIWLVLWFILCCITVMLMPFLFIIYGYVDLDKYNIVDWYVDYTDDHWSNFIDILRKKGYLLNKKGYLL